MAHLTSPISFGRVSDPSHNAQERPAAAIFLWEIQNLGSFTDTVRGYPLGIDTLRFQVQNPHDAPAAPEDYLRKFRVSRHGSDTILTYALDSQIRQTVVLENLDLHDQGRRTNQQALQYFHDQGGNDVLDGGAGSDVLSGSSGRDVFSWGSDSLVGAMLIG